MLSTHSPGVSAAGRGAMQYAATGKGIASKTNLIEDSWSFSSPIAVQ